MLKETLQQQYPQLKQKLVSRRFAGSGRSRAVRVKSGLAPAGSALCAGPSEARLPNSRKCFWKPVNW